MTAITEPPATAVEASPRPQEPPVPGPALRRADGLELLGPVHGCGYRDGACLVRRSDGQMLQLGPLMYALLECLDGTGSNGDLAAALSQRVGRQVGPQPVARLTQKLAAQGLLAGTEQQAPPKRHPLLALRWKVLVTNPKWTRRLTAPFSFLFHPLFVWPVLAAFGGVFWFVLIHKGVAGATVDAFHRPALLLLVFALAVASAGFHELGHAAACRYAGATPGGMGMGLYLVWPAFYTDVTDAYRLPRRDRLRVDLGGLYFNAVVAVVTMGVWLAVRADALLLLIALQVLQMVKQLSPVIRADGYHILSDATGVPDLFAHLVPTLRRLLPGHRREPSALTGRARVLVTLWVLIIVPVLLSLMLGAILLLPKLATTTWESGRMIATAIPHQAGSGQILDVLASLLQLLALALPVVGSVLITQRVVRLAVARARGWSAGRPIRRGLVVMAGTGLTAAVAWAWWPSGQYQPVRADQAGNLPGLVNLVSAPVQIVRPTPQPAPVALSPGAATLSPGTHLAVSMIPVGGATRSHPALFVVAGRHGGPGIAVVSPSAPPLHGPASPGTSAPTPTTQTAGASTAFPFQLPARPGPGGTQALATGTKKGGVTYDIAYSLVTVSHGAPVTESNRAYALAHCSHCTTVAVSFQIVLVVGQSNVIAPTNAAGALNYHCLACITTALADQIVVTLKSQPSRALLAQLQADLRRLNALRMLGANGTPAAVAAQVSAIQHEIVTQLVQSGLLTNPGGLTSTTSTSSPTSPGGGGSPGSSGTSSGTGSSGTSTQTTNTQTSTTPTQTTTTQTSTTPTTSTTTTTTTTSTTPTTTTPSSGTSTTSSSSPSSGSSG